MINSWSCGSGMGEVVGAVHSLTPFFAQVCVAALTGKGEAQSKQGVSPSCDPTQGGQDAALVIQHSTEVSWESASKNKCIAPSWLICALPLKKPSLSVLFLSFESFKCTTASRLQSRLPPPLLCSERKSDAVQRGNRGQHVLFFVVVVWFASTVMKPSSRFCNSELHICFFPLWWIPLCLSQCRFCFCFFCISMLHSFHLPTAGGEKKK